MKKRKKKKIFSPEEEARFARNLRKLEERIAYHKAKLAEEQAQREP
jgi:hypothetical protein